MSLILKDTPAGRRASIITKVDAEAMVAAGDAVGCPGYPEIYEEVTPGEREQGYMTRSMVAVSAKRTPVRASKPAAEPAPTKE